LTTRPSPAFALCTLFEKRGLKGYLSLHDNDAQDEADDHDDADNNNHHRTNSGESSSSYFDAQEEFGDAGEEDALRRADPPHQQHSSSTPSTWGAHTLGSSGFASTSNYSSMTNSNGNEYFTEADAVDEYGRKFSISSQATLVPSSRPTTTSSQSHLYVPQQRRVSQQHQPVLSTIQASESEGPHSSSHAHEGPLDDEEGVRYTSKDDDEDQYYHPDSFPQELREGAGELGDDPSYSPTSRSSPLPPGLPAFTSQTSTAQERGRPKTPYPFPSTDNDPSPSDKRSNSNNQPSDSSNK
ncbi:5009_t:CDS:2, partial [Acaulospora colombiana]